ncbi:hypothetical protein AB6A40_004196 [Gnathostoma spinigerum]|uniref:G-protein coupled receptors family 1 profile domain-containing protein n=1 Tax=Gnathostoma spinigerum TaxID=75299 RepID=A0ABD6EDY5_9BILA
MNESSSKQCFEMEGLGEAELYAIREIIVKVLLIVCPLSTALQVYVLVNAFLKVRRRASDHCIHIFIFNITVADLLLTGFAYPMEFLMDLLSLDFPYWINVGMHFFLWLGTAVSGLSLVLMNIDKLIFFKFPLNYAKRITRSRAEGLAVSTWLASALFIYLGFVTRAFECRYNCQVLATPTGSRYGPLMYLGFTFWVSVFPALSSFTVALYILHIVRSHRKQMHEAEALLVGHGSSRRHRAILSRMRTFYFIFISTIFTVCTLVPYRTLTIYRTLIQSNEEIRSCLAVLVSILFYYLMDLNSILNPLLTVTVLPQYRLQRKNLDRIMTITHNGQRDVSHDSDEAADLAKRSCSSKNFKSV